VSQEKTRKLRIFERDRYVSLDYQAQEAVCFQLVSAGEGQRPNIQKDDLSVANEEPLKCELEDFIEAAATGRKPRVGGDDATAALELALRVVGAMAGADSAN
jgi:predicted dehydrogenase